MSLCLTCKHSSRGELEQFGSDVFGWSFICPVVKEDEKSVYGPSENFKSIIMTETEAWEDGGFNIHECKCFEEINLTL